MVFLQHFNKVLFVFLGLGLATYQPCAALVSITPKESAKKTSFVQKTASKPSFYERTEEALFNSNAFKKLSFNTQIFVRAHLKKLLIAGASLTVAVAAILVLILVINRWEKSNAPATEPDPATAQGKSLEAQLHEAENDVESSKQAATTTLTKTPPAAPAAITPNGTNKPEAKTPVAPTGNPEDNKPQNQNPNGFGTPANNPNPTGSSAVTPSTPGSGTPMNQNETPVVSQGLATIISGTSASDDSNNQGGSLRTETTPNSNAAARPESPTSLLPTSDTQPGAPSTEEGVTPSVPSNSSTAAPAEPTAQNPNPIPNVNNSRAVFQAEPTNQQVNTQLPPAPSNPTSTAAPAQTIATQDPIPGLAGIYPIPGLDGLCYHTPYNATLSDVSTCHSPVADGSPAWHTVKATLQNSFSPFSPQVQCQFLTDAPDLIKQNPNSILYITQDGRIYLEKTGEQAVLLGHQLEIAKPHAKATPSVLPAQQNQPAPAGKPQQKKTVNNAKPSIIFNWPIDQELLCSCSIERRGGGGSTLLKVTFTEKRQSHVHEFAAESEQMLSDTMFINRNGTGKKVTLKLNAQGHLLLKTDGENWIKIGREPGQRSA